MMNENGSGHKTYHESGAAHHYHQNGPDSLVRHYQNQNTGLFSLWPFGKKEVILDEHPVVRFANGTVDWGTPGNRPRGRPAEFY